jgi:invasion protein IalB
MMNLLKAGGVAVVLAVGGLAMWSLAMPDQTAAAASTPTPINKFTDWTASTYDDGGKTLCYATSEPKKQAGKFASRGKPYIAITHAPQANVRDQVSYIAGYEFKPDSEVKVTIGKQTFSLNLLQKDRAWAKDADTDKALVAAMRKGNTLVIKGISSRGTEITDTYSLNGFSKAYQAIGTACKIP